MKYIGKLVRIVSSFRLVIILNLGKIPYPPNNRICYKIPGNVTCSAYPIAQLDSIDSKTGELNTVSALNLIVFGVSFETHNSNPYDFKRKVR